MKNDNDVQVWWASLSVSQKERIAGKGLRKASPDGVVDPALIQYPACSVWWNSLDDEARARIYDHCVSRHGYLQQEWNEADPYGD